MIFVLMDQHLAVGKNDVGSLDVYINQKGTDSTLPPLFVASVLSWEKETKVTRITCVTLHDAENQNATPPVSALGSSN
jgi:hypothetical protein